MFINLLLNKLVHLIKEILLLFRDSFISFSDRQPFRNSAVIAYYAIFSLPGMLVILINLAGYFFGEQAITNQISQKISEMIGPRTAQTVERVIANVYQTRAITISSLVSFVVLFFGATGMFYQVQTALHIMWRVKPKPKRKILKYLRDRLAAFLLMLGFGFLLPVALIISSLLSLMQSWVANNLIDTIKPIFHYMDLGISLGLITLLFASIYVLLTDAKVRWRDVWPGAFLASLLFMLAKYGLGLYFAYSNPGSAYGAAGSIVLIMLWTTYNAMILLYGAEFTRLFAQRFGQEISHPSLANAGHKEKKSDKNKEG